MTTQTEALKLAQKALSNRNAPVKIIYEALHAIKEALAKPEQEPVARVQDLDEVKRKHLVYEKGMDWKDFLYTTPPKRKPQYDKTKMNCFVQDLYDKKIQEGKHGHYEAMFHVVHRAIEAAHGIEE